MSALHLETERSGLAINFVEFCEKQRQNQYDSGNCGDSQIDRRNTARLHVFSIPVKRLRVCILRGKILRKLLFGRCVIVSRIVGLLVRSGLSGCVTLVHRLTVGKGRRLGRFLVDRGSIVSRIVGLFVRSGLSGCIALFHRLTVGKSRRLSRHFIVRCAIVSRIARLFV